MDGRFVYANMREDASPSYLKAYTEYVNRVTGRSGDDALNDWEVRNHLLTMAMQKLFPTAVPLSRTSSAL